MRFNGLRLTKKELYFLPVILFFFFAAYRNFRFYINEQKRIGDYVKLDFRKDIYDEIQTQHTYYLIYKTARDYKDKSGVKIYYFSNKTSPENLDYNSTLYANQKSNGSSEKQNVYLSEVGLYINYYFYPKIVDTCYSDSDLSQKIKYGGGKAVIISDIDLIDQPIKTLPKLKRIPDPYGEKRLVYRNPEPFHVFETYE
ncbi:hypothetical protein GYA28_04875 [Candidatus Roizmanbacteria bacterium]|jgi:hypothetical protein|nr:hypothetical protein [Candidatus Roizmanbacteria bacterium]